MSVRHQETVIANLHLSLLISHLGHALCLFENAGEEQVFNAGEFHPPTIRTASRAIKNAIDYLEEQRHALFQKGKAIQLISSARILADMRLDKLIAGLEHAVDALNAALERDLLDNTDIDPYAAKDAPDALNAAIDELNIQRNALCQEEPP